MSADDQYLLSLVEDYRLLSLYSARAGDASKKVVEIISDYSLSPSLSLHDLERERERERGQESEGENEVVQARERETVRENAYHEVIALFCEKVLPLYTKAVRSLQRVIHELTVARETERERNSMRESDQGEREKVRQREIDFHRYLTECAFKAGYAYHESVETLSLSSSLSSSLSPSLSPSVSVSLHRQRQQVFSSKLLRESAMLFEQVMHWIEAHEEQLLSISQSEDEAEGEAGKVAADSLSSSMMLPEEIQVVLKHAEEAYQLGTSLVEDMSGFSL
jgi:hypothetical protein